LSKKSETIPKIRKIKAQNLYQPKILTLLRLSKTYSDFKDSLSESEREDFFEFVEKATRNLTKPINDLEAWLASKTMAGQNRWEVYYNNFQEFKLLKKSERAKKSVENNALAKWQAQIEEQRKRAEKAWESQKKDV
jgi:hypothetical protein